ncbi:sortase [Arthrobacter sp. AL08]|uniref:sortase domain-containing protein n=1 Tax=unclassified Arthrobacter TaxID=235627 RepID=UPI00249BAEF4|nr:MULTISPECIES: sortase [unclassified Arthrobacter]MDI3243156.1 sortase [Arthrobacter sp. AL05]MDI3279166.1 sortase [Arthrobacter sp. AL08]
MKRTTTAEGAGGSSAPWQRTAERSPAARHAAAALTMALLIAGCAAPQDVVAPLTPATESPATESAAMEASVPDAGRPSLEPPPPVQAATPAVPTSAIPVRPATPLVRAPKDPAPRFLTVEGTTINMPIVQVGVSPDGAMEIPDPFDEAGWYRYGPAPGAAAGSAVLAAHVDTTSDSAPFSQLKSLAPGTIVTVQREGSAALTFRVTGVELMAKDAFDGVSIFRRDGPPQLKLVTCGGRWLDEQQDYGDNVIVTAAPA